MGKKKNKKKVSGAVKTAQKTEKKLAQKLKKELADLGEEDITKVIAQIEREDAKRAAATEKALKGPPSARAYASLTPHPTNNELIMFGGEYHNGQRTEVYNDLLFYNPVNNSWRQVKAPGAPPPRSAHQSITTSANNGEMWVFGGEFTSPSETQFYHYKDLWCFSLADKKWEKVTATGGPSPRSGHRMVQLGRKLFIFGGYADDGRECRYFDELYAFCLDTRVWSKVEAAGRGPCARSACLMFPINNNSLLVYGGFSRIRSGRTERTVTHGDMYRLVERAGPGSWSWRSGPTSGAPPPPRAGATAAVATHANRGYVFGGVADVEETEEELRGEMSDDLQLLELETGRWHHVTLRGDRMGGGDGDARGGGGDGTGTPGEGEVTTVVTDEVFTMRLGGASEADHVTLGAGGAQSGSGARSGPGARGGPGARMAAMMAVQRSVLYIYGGVLEKDEKHFYLSDMYCLDLHKLNEWKTLVEQTKLPDWLGSDSENDSEGDSDSDSESGSE